MPQGDTFTVDGAAVTAQQQNGDSLDDECFKSGAAVPCIYDVGNKTLNFKPSGGTKLNLFVQPDEPATKDGIWIKAPEKHTVKNITGKNSFTIGGEIRTYDSSQHVSPDYTSLTDYERVVILTHNDDIYKIVGSYSPPNLWVNIYRWDHVTKTEVLLYQAYTTVSGQGAAYAISSCIACISGNTLYAAAGVNYYDTSGSVVCKVDLETNTGTKYTSGGDVTTTGSYQVFMFHASGQIGFKNTIAYYTVQFYDSDTKEYSTELRSFNFVTREVTYIKTIISGSTTALGWAPYSEGVLVDNKIYYHVFDTENKRIIRVLDINTGTETILNLSYNLRESFYGITAYQNKLYMLVNDYPTAIYVVDTYSSTDYQIFTFAILLFAIIQIGTSLVVLDTSGNMQYYDFLSETLPENSLAILDGTSRITKLISSDKMNYIRMVFQDVWWYDTDFKEYPTYIGNGTSWTKYKN